MLGRCERACISHFHGYFHHSIQDVPFSNGGTESENKHTCLTSGSSFPLCNISYGTAAWCLRQCTGSPTQMHWTLFKPKEKKRRFLKLKSGCGFSITKYTSSGLRCSVGVLGKSNWWLVWEKGISAGMEDEHYSHGISRWFGQKASQLKYITRKLLHVVAYDMCIYIFFVPFVFAFIALSVYFVL